MSEFSPGGFKSLGTKRSEKEKPAERLVLGNSGFLEGNDMIWKRVNGRVSTPK